MATLSKSRFLSGSQCEKKLFFDVFRKELRPPVSAEQQALFNTGHTLGRWAQAVFPGGRDATEGMDGRWKIAIDRTKQWIDEGHPTIFEAAFSFPGGFSALDILHHQDGERRAIEVKSSTEVKEYHISDASYQYFVMNKTGYAPDKVFLMHINNRYVKNGPVDPVSLFHLADITEAVLDKQEAVNQKQAALLKMLASEAEPRVEIGPHCSSPFHCDYKGHCWAHLPENNVFDLTNARGKDWELYKDGILSMRDVPDDFSLNHRQQLQVRGVKYKERYLDKEAIAEFLKPLEGPLYFLDFETINPAVPVLNGTRPFEQIPFQYSLHITDMNGNIIKHDEFLANPKDFTSADATDPRLQMIHRLKKQIGPAGSIIAYNASFEITRLKGLAIAFPQEKDFIDSLISRFIDLLIPFREGWLYNPDMGDSASIKSVLPSLAPEFSYKDLKIASGGLASDMFRSMIETPDNPAFEGVTEDLLKYCERDSEGMVVIYRKLREVVG